MWGVSTSQTCSGFFLAGSTLFIFTGLFTVHIDLWRLKGLLCFESSSWSIVLTCVMPWPGSMCQAVLRQIPLFQEFISMALVSNSVHDTIWEPILWFSAWCRTGFMVTTVAETVEQANEMELENLPSLHLWPWPFLNRYYDLFIRTWSFPLLWCGPMHQDAAKLCPRIAWPLWQ